MPEIIRSISKIFRGRRISLSTPGNGLPEAALAVSGDRILHHAHPDRLGRSQLTASFVLLGIFFSESYFIICNVNWFFPILQVFGWHCPSSFFPLSISKNLGIFPHR
jgi:hypothetical protein